MAEENRGAHKFKRSMDFIQPVSMVGEAAVGFEVRQIEQSDDRYWTGVQEAKKYSVPVMEAMAYAAAKETAISMKAEINQITVTAQQAERLVRDGKISMADLGDKKLLVEKLKQTKGFSGFDRRKMVRYRQCAHDMLLLKSTLETEERFRGLIEGREREYLCSREFFDLGSKKTNDLLKLYFKHSQNDVLRSVSPAALNQKQIKKLKKTGDKNGFSAQDEAAIRLVERQIQNRDIRIKAGRMLNIKKRVEWLKSCAVRMDENAGAGLQNALYAAQVAEAGYAVAKFGLKLGIVTASFAGKYTGVSYLLHVLNHVRQQKMQQASHVVKKIIRESRPYQAAAAKKEVAWKWINEKPPVQKFKELQKKAGAKRKAAARKINRTRAAARAAGRRVKQGANVVLSPVRIAGRFIHFFRGGLGKVRLLCMAIAGACVTFFLLLVVLINAILSICRTEAETAFSYIMTEDDAFMGEVSALLQQKADKRHEEAEKAFSNILEDSYVYGGRRLERYGSPDGEGGWTTGGKVVYVDGKGNQLLLHTNNSKDVIVVSYILMDADFDEHVTARDDLILDVWRMMNPALVFEESEIYTCEGGCETYHYSCDSGSDAAEIGQLEADGVVFFGSLEECERPEEGSGAGEGVMQPFSCGGHNISVCYGHKDLTVYVPVISMEEIFESGELPTAQGKSYQAFLEGFEGWTEENIEWAQSLYNADWFDLYGTDPSIGSGGSVEMSTEQINAIVGGYGGIDAARAAVCEDAMSFVGTIPYYWGGKAASKSYEGNDFYSIVTADYKGRNKKGLDCSGFVQWVVWRVTDVKLGSSTASITSGMEQITAAELQPGDLGLMAIPGSSTNHVGIFVGYDETGRGLWCHENSSAGNVSVNATTCFKYYYRLF